MKSILNDIEQELNDALCAEFSFYERNGKLYLISPFYYDDGDGLHIAIEPIDDNKFRITDEGTSLMRLTYDLDISQINKGTRKDVIDSLIGHYGIKDRLGEYVIETSKDNISDAVFRMVHFCIRISDIDFLSKGNVRNTFIEDFKQEAHLYFGKDAKLDWYDEEKDEKGEYKVDIVIEDSGHNIGVFPMYTDYQLMNNTITIYHLKEWGYQFNFLGVIEERKKVSETNTRKFSDVSENIYFLDNKSVNKNKLFNDIQKMLTA